jgi:hypothetical protein
MLSNPFWPSGGQSIFAPLFLASPVCSLAVCGVGVVYSWPTLRLSSVTAPPVLGGNHCTEGVYVRSFPFRSMAILVQRGPDVARPATGISVLAWLSLWNQRDDTSGTHALTRFPSPGLRHHGAWPH